MSLINQVNEARISTIKTLAHFYSLQGPPGSHLPSPPDMEKNNQFHANAALTNARNAVEQLNLAVIERRPDLGDSGVASATKAIEQLQQGMKVLQGGLQHGWFLDAEKPLNAALETIRSIPGSGAFRPVTA